MISNSLAPNTRRTYSSAQKRYLEFCEEHSLLHANGSAVPASELTLLRFIGTLSSSLQASSFKVYLAAIRSLHIQNGYADPFIERPRIPLVIRGLRRSQANRVKTEKLPITSLILHSLRAQFDLSQFDEAMVWAACCTAFSGFLRAAEFTVSGSYSSQHHLSLASLSVDKSPLPDAAYLHLAFSKVDQFGKGCEVVLARSDNAICPVSALMAYVRMRGPNGGPLFQFQDGTPLSRSRLNSRVRQALTSAGWKGHFTMHSFRIGAATTAAALGFPETLIKALGRWSSETYKVYIKLSQHRLLLASRTLNTADLAMLPALQDI